MYLFTDDSLSLSLSLSLYIYIYIFIESSDVNIQSWSKQYCPQRRLLNHSGISRIFGSTSDDQSIERPACKIRTVISDIILGFGGVVPIRVPPMD